MSRSTKPVVAVLISVGIVVPVLIVFLAASLHLTLQSLGESIPSLDVSLSSRKQETSTDTGVFGNWPPKLGRPFPELVLIDQTGNPFRMSDLKGKVIFIEYAAISCQGCQAFAGGHELGTFGGFRAQAGLESIERYAKRYAGVELGSEDVVFVQILLYGKGRQHPTADEVRGWAKHFEMDRDQNRIVLGADASMIGPASYAMIPGFQLVDRQYILRSDSCGHRPKDDLYRDLLPLLGRLARKSPAPN